MKICKIAIDIANNMSAIGTKWYEVEMDETGKEIRREYIPGTTRLWMDGSAQSHNSALIPSVILYKSENTDVLEKDYIGWNAMDMLKKTNVVVKNPRSNIKYSYFVKGKMFGENAGDFQCLMGYLMDCISFEKGGEPDAYELSISYPVICQDADKGGLEEIVGDVWFELGKPQRLLNQEMIDEAECALRFALANKTIAEQLGKRLSINPNQLVLVVDIGGSTMELCLYKFYAQDNKGKYKRLEILRADDEEGRGMGSYKVDKALKNKLQSIGVLDPQKINNINSNLLLLRYFAPLKEELNEKLKAGKEARLTKLHPISDATKLNQHISVDRATFEAWCKGYTDMICRQINAICEKAHKTVKDIGMVILTGGGCELYPVEPTIRAVLAKNTPVLRPTDPTGVLDYQIQDGDRADYIHGLCPCAEVASLACVLGNLAEEAEIVIPPPPPPAPAPKPNYIPPDPPTPVVKKVYTRELEAYCKDCFINVFGSYKKCPQNCVCDTKCIEYSCATDCRCDYHCSDCDDCWFCEYEREY